MGNGEFAGFEGRIPSAENRKVILFLPDRGKPVIGDEISLCISPFVFPYALQLHVPFSRQEELRRDFVTCAPLLYNYDNWQVSKSLGSAASGSHYLARALAHVRCLYTDVFRQHLCFSIHVRQ